MTRAQALGAAAVVALTACATPSGPWVTSGLPVALEAQVQAYIHAAKVVTPDKKGFLAWGGDIIFKPDLTGYCVVPPGKRVSGCSEPGVIWVLWPTPWGGEDITRTSLQHEICHLGLASGGAFGGPLTLATDAQADACALLVNQYVLKEAP